MSVAHGDLGAVQVGRLLTTTTLAMLVGAMQIGYAAERFGTRGPLLPAAALGVAIALLVPSHGRVTIDALPS